MKFQAVKGTRDFYPEKMAFRNWLFEKMRKVSTLYGYQEYEGPILEPLDLYAIKSGEELVNEQTFIVIDRGGEKLALRPELTPTLARMVAQKQQVLGTPLRLFSIGPFWRYEQPQKGRTREFFQWNVDLLGWDVPEADAEVISIAAQIFKDLGLTPSEIKIKINNRKYMEEKFKLVGFPTNFFPQILKLIDRKDKMEEKLWIDLLKKAELSELQIKDLQNILADRDYANESEELTSLFSTLSDLEVADYVELDPRIVRGLDYYTGTVFEARDASGELRSILGGGRYNNLVETVGGQPLSGVGFAAGDVLLELILEKYNKFPQLPTSPTKVLVTIFNEAFFRNSLNISNSLREAGINTELYLDSKAKLDKQLKYADKLGIPFVVIIGPEEQSSDTVILKNMKEKSQEKINLNELVNKFQ